MIDHVGVGFLTCSFFFYGSDALDFASSQVDYYVKQWLQLSTRNVFIMEAALACLHCVVQAVDLERVISALESSIGDRSSVTLSTSACRLVAAFVNKLAEGKSAVNDPCLLMSPLINIS